MTIAEMLDASDIPRDYRRKSCDNYAPRTVKQRAALNVVCDWPFVDSEYTADSYLNLVLMGPVGTGKTHLAAMLALEYVEGGDATCWRSFTALMREFKESRLHSDLFGRYGEEVDLLVIDDLGIDADMFDTSTLVEILDIRTANGLRTIATTNCNRTALKDLLGERGYSRLMYRCAVVVLDGDDYRLTGGKVP